MPVSGFVQECVDRLSDVLGGVKARGMFGGFGIYHQGRMFALVANDQLYLKADVVNRDTYIDGGSTPFLYESKGTPVTMSYYLADLDADEFAEWTSLAVDAAERAATAKPVRPPRGASPKKRTKIDQ